MSSSWSETPSSMSRSAPSLGEAVDFNSQTLKVFKHASGSTSAGRFSRLGGYPDAKFIDVTCGNVGNFMMSNANFGPVSADVERHIVAVEDFTVLQNGIAPLSFSCRTQASCGYFPEKSTLSAFSTGSRSQGPLITSSFRGPEQTTPP